MLYLQKDFFIQFCVRIFTNDKLFKGMMMNRKFYLLGLPLVALLATACGQKNDAASAGEDEITEFDINQKLVSAQKDYKVVTDYGTVYLELSTSIHWPEKMGGFDLSTLRDSLLNFAYSDTTSTSIREAVKKYIADTSVVDGAKDIVVVDSLPADSMTYFNTITANVLDLNEQMVTYQVVGSTFLGGAHPMTAIHPFTYDFTETTVLDNGNIYLPGTPTDSIVPIIKDALARQLGVPVKGLDRAGIWSNQLTYAGRPYIANNTLFFHYDPYEIGPYALGAVDVAVYPYEIDRFLKPSVRKLFDEGF